MSLVFDEYGRPFIVIRDAEEKVRIKGLQAQKVQFFISFHPSLPPSPISLPLFSFLLILPSPSVTL
jgi:hypothetical protein